MTTEENRNPSLFFARLKPEERDELIVRGKREEIAKGKFVFRVGNPATHVYFLERGRVKIFHRNPSGKELLLWFCVPGEIFGLAELHQGGSRQVSAQASEQSRILSIERGEFDAFVERHPSAALVLIDVLSQRLRGLGHLVQAIVADDVNKRVAQLLIRLGKSYGRRDQDGTLVIEMRLTHQEMANMIGTSRQSVTSLLNALKQQGVLDIKNRYLQLRDEMFLQQMAAQTDTIQQD